MLTGKVSINQKSVHIMICSICSIMSLLPVVVFDFFEFLADCLDQPFLQLFVLQVDGVMKCRVTFVVNGIYITAAGFDQFLYYF